MVVHAVVDRLEVVEVEHHEREALAPLAEAGEAAAKQPAVGQAGKVVVVGLGRDLLLGHLGLGKIAENGDILLNFAGFAQGADHQLLRIELAVLALVPHFATPHPHPLQRVVHVGIEGLIVQPGLEHAGTLAPHLVAAVASDLLEGRVDRDDAAIGIAHQNRFGEVVVDPVRELELLRMTLERIDILQQHHQVVRLLLLVADQGDSHPPPQDLAPLAEVALLLGETAALTAPDLFVALEAALPILRVIDVGDGAMKQLV